MGEEIRLELDYMPESWFATQEAESNSDQISIEVWTKIGKEVLFISGSYIYLVIFAHLLAVC